MAPMTCSASSRIGRRITTSGSVEVSSMSRRSGRPVVTTSRIKLLGITLSQGLPMASWALARPKRWA
ncbi:hypothetical protein D3C77_736210 [compost metagenome]